MASTGEAVQIVKYHPANSGSSKFEYIDNEVQRIFLAENVKDKKAVIISIAGPARKGKSLMLGYFMKYLLAPNKDISSWDENEPLESFQWGGGSTSITTGLWIWSKPFFAKSASGEEVAVFLMDSQGLYDRDSTMNDCALIFAFSVLFSSIQVYNLMQDIQYVDLDHLEMFVNFGKYAEQWEKFQRLVFLVRDWRYPQDFQYGEEGGKLFLDSSILEKNNKRDAKETHKRIPEMLEKCFENVDCFLLPYPGDVVSTGVFSESNNRYRGDLKSMSSKFKTQLQSFLSFILTPSKLEPKTICGIPQTCRHLVEVFKNVSTKLKSDKVDFLLDSLKPCFQGMVSTMYANLKSDVCRHYYDEIEKVLVNYMEPEILKLLHMEISNAARHIITDYNQELFKKHLGKDIQADLDDFFKKEYENVKLKNKSKYTIFGSFSRVAKICVGGGVGASLGGATGIVIAEVTAMHAVQILGTVSLGSGLGTAVGVLYILYSSKSKIYSTLQKLQMPKISRLWRREKEHSD